MRPLVDSGTIPFSAEEENGIGKLYSLWLLPSDRLLQEIDRFESSGFQVDRADEFREAVSQARSCAWHGPLTPEEIQRIQRFQSLSAEERTALVESHPPPTEWFDEEALD